MQTCGIIAEYNPFHLGHAHHIHCVRAMTDASAIVVALSGSFVQRGEAACFDKWTRASWALQAGADLVLELPTVYVLQSAQSFARAGVALLSAVGCGSLCFGSELEDLSLIKTAATRLAEESADFTAALRAQLQLGKSYPRALHEAYVHCFGEDRISQALRQPNFLLGVEYLRAIAQIAPHMQAHPLKRKGSGYHANSLQEEFPSAHAIRSILNSGEKVAVLPCVPPFVAQDIERLSSANRANLENTLLYTLRMTNAQQLHRIYGMDEGLENRLYKAAEQSSLHEALTQLKTKRYTLLRLNRLLCCTLLGIEKTITVEANRTLTPYFRVLGYRDGNGARALIAQMSRNNIPLIFKKRDMTALTGLPAQLMRLDCLATDIAALCFDTPEQRASKQDFFRKPVVL